MTEKQIISEFKALCIATIDPEAYAYLVERITPQLEMSRSALGRQPLESFFCRACQEKYAGIPCNDLGECTQCAGWGIRPAQINNEYGKPCEKHKGE